MIFLSDCMTNYCCFQNNSLLYYCSSINLFIVVSIYSLWFHGMVSSGTLIGTTTDFVISVYCHLDLLRGIYRCAVSSSKYGR